MRKLVLLALLIAVAGCSSYSEVTETESVEGEWTLLHASLKGQSVTATSLPDRFVVHFQSEATSLPDDQGQLSGRSACNSLQASYRTISDVAIVLKDVLSTRVWCGESNATAEQALMALQRPSRYEIAGQTLRIEFDSGALFFKRTGE